MVNDVDDYFVVSRLRVATLDIFCPRVFPDSISFGVIPAAVINDGIDGPFDRILQESCSVFKKQTGKKC